MMRKLVLLIALACSLAACGSVASGRPSLLDRVQRDSIQKVETKLAGMGVVKFTVPTFIGTIAKDNAGNHSTLVYVLAAQNDGSSLTLVIMVVEFPDGTLDFADVMIPSGMVTIRGANAPPSA